MRRARLPERWRHYEVAVRRFVVHDLLHAHDPPHRLALGVALGVFVAFTPTLGVQMVLVVFLATLFRANRAVGLPFVWITNPTTCATIYYGCYLVGRKLLGRPALGRTWWADLSRPPAGWWPSVVFYWSRFSDVAWPLWLGGILVGLAAGIPSYVAVYWGVRAYRLRRWRQIVPPPGPPGRPLAEPPQRTEPRD
ncbi:MAG TPA: DUF2062 domain-containing protein [Thermoguttaceae bacterium]|nr:DUF2062 domain-containing protein [Thermoguttaceae bacterium]